MNHEPSTAISANAHTIHTMKKLTHWKAQGANVVRRLVPSNRQKPKAPSLSMAQTNIPFDVFTAIFETYTDDFRSEHTEFSNKAVPWKLGHICRSWRQAALSSSSCWNVFTFWVTEDNADNELPEMYQQLLQRCGSKPLQFLIEFSRYSEPLPQQPLRVFEPILDRCSQWGHIVLQGLDVPEIHRQFGPAQGKLSSLHTLKIYFRSSITREDNPTPTERRRKVFDFFKDAPALSEVLLNDMSSRLKKYEIVLPWDQLKTFITYGLPEGIFPTELERQTNLQSLTCVHNKFPTFPAKPISHQHLRNLYIYATNEIEACFTHMAEVTLPALETLSVSFLTMELRYNLSAIPALTTLIINSKCQLKTLVIQQNCTTSIDTLPTLFSQIPSLETLDIGHGLFFVPILGALCYDQTKPTLLPNLRRLCVTYSTSTYPSDMRVVSDLINSRQQVSTNLDIPGQLLAPLLYVRLFIRRSETRYFAFLDLINEYVPPPPSSKVYPMSFKDDPKPDSYPLSLLSVPDFDTKLNKAVPELRELLDPNKPPSPEAIAKWREISKMYYERILTSSPSNLNTKEKEAAEGLRELCRTHFPPTFYDERQWMVVDPSYILFIHKNHPIRYSSNKSNLIMGVKHPAKADIEGYGYWLDENTDNLLENLRTFVN